VTQETSAIARNLLSVRERIARAARRAGRSADEIALVAISKTFPADAIRAAYEAGARHFGENRVQEFEAKRGTLAELDATWHFIGHLQSNKARRAVQLFSRVDSVDSLTPARKLDSAAAEQEKILPVLIEVHLGGEETKSGVEEADLLALAEGVTALKHVALRGLMAIPPYAENPEDARPHFKKLRELHQQISKRIGKPLPVLSMGMSHDFEVAIEEGATEVRVGTAIFGERNYAEQTPET
jgi:pyridoxal phosphate enzyme (YggS family)